MGRPATQLDVYQGAEPAFFHGGCTEVPIQRVSLYFCDNIQNLCQFCYGRGWLATKSTPPPWNPPRVMRHYAYKSRNDILTTKTIFIDHLIYRCDSYNMLEMSPKLFQKTAQDESIPTPFNPKLSHKNSSRLLNKYYLFTSRFENVHSFAFVTQCISYVTQRSKALPLLIKKALKTRTNRIVVVIDNIFNIFLEVILERLRSMLKYPWYFFTH